MRNADMTPEETMEIEIRQLKEMAARYGGVMNRERERCRAAAGRAKAALAPAVREGASWGKRR